MHEAKFERTVYDKDTIKVPAVNQRGEKTEEQSNKRATLYKAPYSRMAITSCANQKNEGLRTYSCIPLHLRKDCLFEPHKTHVPTMLIETLETRQVCHLNKHVSDDRSTPRPIRAAGSRGYSS